MLTKPLRRLPIIFISLTSLIATHALAATWQYAQYEGQVTVLSTSGGNCRQLPSNVLLEASILIRQDGKGRIEGYFAGKQFTQGHFQGKRLAKLSYPFGDPNQRDGHSLKIVRLNPTEFSATVREKPAAPDARVCNWQEAELSGVSESRGSQAKLATVFAEQADIYQNTLNTSVANFLSEQATTQATKEEKQGHLTAAESTLSQARAQILKVTQGRYLAPALRIVEAQIGLYVEQKKWAAAIGVLTPMLSARTSGFEAYQIHYLIAQINEKAGQDNDALLAYQQALAAFLHIDQKPEPDDKVVLATRQGIAKLLAKQGKAAEAEQEMQALLDSLGNDPAKHAEARFAALSTFKQIAQQNNNAALTRQVDQQLLAIGQKMLFAHMQKNYLWNDGLPKELKGEFSKIEDVLEALKHKPDDHWSYITPLEDAQSAQRGEFFGIGLDFTPDRQRRLRISFITPGSPADKAGIQRGDIIEAIGGKTIAELRANPKLYTLAVGENRAGVTVSFDLVSPDGQVKKLNIAKDKVHAPAIPLLQIIEERGRKFGYIYVSSFLSLTTGNIDDAVAKLKQAGIEELVVDLRYNGGGSVYISSYLAAAIAGDVVKGKIYQRLKFNPLLKRIDEDKFPAPAQTLGLKRLAVLATDDTCSASEALINGLRPFIPVTMIGTTTCGKPVGMETTVIGPWMLAPISFRIYNALDQGEYFAGLKPDCPMADDLEQPLGNRNEGMLAEALSFFNTGECSGLALRGKAVSLKDLLGAEKTGLHREIGAF